MIKKVILTETQYNKLIQFINETPYPKVIEKVKIGDIIRVEFKNSVNNFKVVNSSGNQIQMDNIDSGSANINYRYFISSASLHGNDLQIRRAHKIKEKDKLTDVKSWKQLDVKDIKNIEVIRNGDIIDSVDKPNSVISNDNQHNDEHTEEFRAKVDDIVSVFLKEIKNGKGLDIKLASGNIIHMCCDIRHENDFIFTILGQAPVEELNDWDSFSISLKGEGKNSDEDLYALNNEFIKTSDGGKTIDIMFQAISGEKFKEVIVRGVDSISSTPNCGEEPKTDEKETNASDDIETPEDVKANAEEMIKAILEDPIMKKAFYKKPSLWNMIVSAAMGKNPRGTGIGPALNIINQYGEAKQKRKLGDSGRNFRAGKRAKFEVMFDEIVINPTGDPNDLLRLIPGRIYDAEVNAYKLGGPQDIVLTNKILGISITVLNQYRELEDTFEVKIRKSIKGRKTQEITDSEKIGILKLINEPGSGYAKPTGTEPNTK